MPRALRVAGEGRPDARREGAALSRYTASPSNTADSHPIAATQRDGAIRPHGFVVRRLFGLDQTALLTPRPAPELQTVAHVWDVIRDSLPILERLNM